MKVKIISLKFFIILLSISLIFLFYNDIKFYLYGEKFEIKIFKSPSKNKVITLMLHTQGLFNYFNFIYIIPNEYTQKRIPSNSNYIKFPDATGVVLDWKNENVVDIFSDSEPLENTFYDSNLKINIKVSRELIEDLNKNGKKIIRYEI